MNKLQLNPDRADVIVPATDIYLSAMKWAHAEEIIVPDVGLKDGIIQMLYEKHNKPKSN
jgi:exopolyphosphatase/guanosine-5'-triphosphate,3'-diphosphate pyrophosphatase